MSETKFLGRINKIINEAADTYETFWNAWNKTNYGSKWRNRKWKFCSAMLEASEIKKTGTIKFTISSTIWYTPNSRK